MAVLQSAARARCTGPTCGRRHVRRGSPRGSAPTTSNAPPWHRGADDQAQRMTPGKRSRASTIAAGRRAAPNHGGRAAAARGWHCDEGCAAVDRQAHASTRTQCSEGKGEGLAPSPRGELPRPTTRPRTHHPAVSRSAGLQPVFACRLSFDSGALSAQRRVPDGDLNQSMQFFCVSKAIAELEHWYL